MRALDSSARCLVPVAFSLLLVASGCSSSSDDAGSGGSATTAGTTSGGNATGGGGTGTSGSGAAGMPSGGSSAGVAGASAGGGGAGSAGSGGVSAGAGGTSGSGGATAGSGGSSGSAGTPSGGSGGSSSGGFTLTSPGWTSQANCSAMDKTGCGIFPKDNIGTSLGGMNKSPELDWSGAPSGTQGYAIVLHDLTNIMNNKPFVHWVMWNIPAATTMLPAGLETTAMPSVPAGASQRSYAGNGFQGSGACGNVYEFVLYALTASFTPSAMTTTAVADGLAATSAPTATLRARSGAPGCTE